SCASCVLFCAFCVLFPILLGKAGRAIFLSGPVHAHVGCEADRAQCADHVPAQINLPPAAAEAGRGGICVMVAVPVLSPCGQLERAEPPYVLAGIHSFGKSWLQMQETVHEGLHVKAIDKANRAHPKEAGPAKQEITEKDRREDT